MNSPVRIFLFLAAAISAAAQTAPSPSGAQATWNVRGHIPLERFIIQSHRGAGELAEENTIEAFELGWKLGTYPEADLRTTKDGIIVAFHDNDFSRVVKDIAPDVAKKGVADVTFEELSRLDVGSWKGDSFKGRRVVKMSDVFERMKGRPERHLYMDIKNVKLRQLADEVKQAGVEKQVVLASPRHAIIREWKALVPQSDTLIWIGGKEDAQRKQIDALRAANFEGITQLQVHVRPAAASTKADSAAEPFSPPRAFLAALSGELASRGILFQTLPWGAKDETIYAQLLDLGFASFATDYPEVTFRAVRAYYSQAK